MFDLQPGVHLEEVPGRRVVGDGGTVDDEFDGAGRVVPDPFGQRHCGVVELGPGRVGQVRGRGLLEELLVAALHRAFAGPEMHDAAVGVADDLHLDMARTLR